ncbi:MAG: AbrB/MazE/SpoVT family DNA-binding domain-containing protein [Finegoldia magna]|uniref:AbrB/MazE/SpoVT family DNA-binding domain-containing protein n=1 Tax=Finegoldia magna TaxID=1260 RepID=UPI000448ECAA|nr:AbrB/MazE/SpoVT family DNA-binding domain-containing protein [Finegoldia magna]EXF27760.1 AbrB family transcriptional regulator [Finegoldia magna ALB8]MDU5527418.1 AbrB/MazE/SpoVT family DNA-binding domain-containing protein [Finegoldia magna]MSB16228.1 AbrB/MazE/SpoVT family DNA-binding domain-containing protein [Finegoldia magna]MSD44966.1 AbrB/MazE/SpoVT family DNA-binding domain-containing protein [Finegoldia magna]
MNFEIEKGNKITIPDILMRKYDLREKDVFELELENDRIILIPKKNHDANYVEKLKGLTDDTIDALHEDE